MRHIAITPSPHSPRFRNGFAALILLLLLPATSYACELRMGWEPWKPYQYRSADGVLTGLDIDLMKAITNQMGCDLELVELPWKRHLRDLREGRIDIAAGADYSEQRSDYAWFSDAYRTETVNLFVRAGETSNYELNALDDVLKGDFRLGISRGYDYGKAFDAIARNPEFEEHVQPARNDLLNYRKLMRKRIDAILTDPLVLNARVEGTKFEGAFEPYPLEIKLVPIRVMFSRQSTSEALVRRFNKAMTAITQNGTYDRIYNRYIRNTTAEGGTP